MQEKVYPIQEESSFEKKEEQKKTVPADIHSLLTSFRFLFEKIVPGNAGENQLIFHTGTPLQQEFLLSLKHFLLQAEKEQKEKKEVLLDLASGQMDSIDLCNHLLRLFSGQDSMRNLLDECLFSALAFLAEKELEEKRESIKKNFSDPETLEGLYFKHAFHFAGLLADFLQKYPSSLKKHSSSLPSRLLPWGEFQTLSHSFFCRSTLSAAVMELYNRRKKQDIFEKSTVFRYRKASFTPSSLPSIRKAEEFYGYREAKELFKNHLGAFSSGKHNIPLLISGLPGLGKTQMTIAHILADQALTLILPSPEDLENGLENLIHALSLRKDKKFVIFFDDMDVRNVDWYYFRTFVGGSYSLPENQMIIIASNYTFPPNISSRGRSFSFPLFDEIRCQEMIADMFLAKGMNHISQDLLSVIAADYVETFGQKEFDELSPRTLARYLELFLADQLKRKRLLEFSKGELITRPDPQIFHEQNVKLMRALYGEEAVDELRKSQFPC